MTSRRASGYNYSEEKCYEYENEYEYEYEYECECEDEYEYEYECEDEYASVDQYISGLTTKLGR